MDLASRLKIVKTKNDRFKIIRDFLLLPMLAELTDGTGLVHRVFTYTYGDGEIYGLSLLRNRPKTCGFWNCLARFFSDQAVMYVEMTGQLWCCRYYLPYYFVPATKIKDEYYAKLKEKFVTDFVVVGD